MPAKTAETFKDIGILFKPPMVRAIIEDRKFQTRRVMKLQPTIKPQLIVRNGYTIAVWPGESEFDVQECRCPYGTRGRRLWVRESFFIDHLDYETGRLPKDRPADLEPESIHFVADGTCCEQIPECACAEVGKPKSRPSLLMPRWVSRIDLNVSDVRVEQLVDISKADAVREGAEYRRGGYSMDWSRRDLVRETARGAFQAYWDDINRDRGFPWNGNLWVWVISFRRIKP
jgi:hypothetical protein